MMKLTWSVLRSKTIPFFFRSFSCQTPNNPILKVINDGSEEFIKLTFKMNQPHYFNIKAPKTEELRVILNKIKFMATLQRKKDAIRQTIGNKYSGTTQLAVQAEDEVDVCLIKNDIEIDERLPNIDAWANGSFLKIGDVIYEIRYNYPTVILLSLPDYILAGCIIRAHAIMESALLTDGHFIWYHSLSKDEVEKLSQEQVDSDNFIAEGDHCWLKVGDGFFYQTSDKDAGRHIRVNCIPKSGNTCGQNVSAYSSSVVEKISKILPFEERHKFTKEYTDEHRIRCVSYNVLANVYVEKKKFPYCSLKAKDVYYRKQLLFRELLGYKSDIICLQEVTERIFDYDIKFILGSMGYEGFYTRKGGRRYEGIATFFRKSKFRLVSHHRVVLNEVIKEKKIFIDLLSKVSGNYKDMSKLLAQDTVYQATVLEDTTPLKRKILVANTHLYSNKDTPEVRLLQAAMCAYYSEHILKTQDLCATGVLFCGDFNSLPNSSAFNFLRTGYFECCPTWKNKIDTSEPESDTILKHNLNLESACGTPKYTNYTEEFNGCLDYIFYSKDYWSVSDVVPMPKHEIVTEQVALPSEYFPSDHLALVCTLKWNIT